MGMVSKKDQRAVVLRREDLSTKAVVSHIRDYIPCMSMLEFDISQDHIYFHCLNAERKSCHFTEDPP